MVCRCYPYINWLQKLTVYETPTYIYLAASDEAETRFRVLKIARIPVPFTDSLDPTEATLAAETPLDRLWRLDIFEDPHCYTRRELNLLISTIQAVNRDASVPNGSFLRRNVTPTSVRSHALSPAAEENSSPSTENSSSSSTDSDTEKSNSTTPLSSELTMEVTRTTAAAAAATVATASPTDSATGTAASIRPLSTSSLVQSLTGFGLVGFVRFLFGYYLIVITQRREVARIGEHRIYKIEDTKMIYVPGEPFVSLKKLLERSSAERCKASLPAWAQDSVGNSKLSRLVAEEMRYLKLFHSIDLNGNFYFSYSYDLTNSLQRNLEPFSEARNHPQLTGDNATATQCDLLAFRLLPNDRFTWNFGLLPPRLCSPERQYTSNWFVRLVHGFLKQAVFACCGMPITITLLARRSRFFAGTRFLKRGVNLTGDVANEVETEQIVADLSNSTLARARASSFTQLRGSVPLFWSQETTKLVVGKPPLEINWEDPFYEAFGLHFANLIERFGAPIIVLNLMKQKEKRRFEQQLTEGYCRGIDYLNLFAPILSSQPDRRHDEIPPIVYIGFDMARMQKSPNLLVLDRLRPIAEACVQRTGIFFSTGAESTFDPGLQSSTDRTRIFVGSDLWPRQHGVIRVNCVDCLDRTNAGQYVIGHVVLAHQLRALGLLPETGLTFSSALSRLLQDLYEEHGDTLALQYGGSCLVHNIETYQRTGKLRSQSRDLMQTLSRYYSNNFSDFEKQLATDIFLRVYRPGAWVGSLATFETIRPSSQPPVEATSLPSPLPTPDHDGLMATIAATTAASSSFPCDAAAEAHLHWLDSWARLPLYRPPLTGWWPLGWDVYSPRECGVYWKTWCELGPESSAPSTRYAFLSLLSSDPRTDWFTELYPATQWTHFNTLTFCQLPVSTAIADRSPSPLCLLQMAQLNQAYRPLRTSLRSSHSVGDFYRPSGSVPATQHLPPVTSSSQAPPPLGSPTPQATTPAEPLPVRKTTAAAMARPPVVKGKRMASKKGGLDDSLLLSDWALGGAEDQNSSDSDESVLTDSFIVASPPTLLDRWRLARKSVTPDRGNKPTVAAEPGSSLGPPAAVPEPPSHSLVNDTLQWFNYLRLSDLSTLSPKLEPAAVSGTVLAGSLPASKQITESPVVAVHYGQLQDGPAAPERTYNLCTSYSDFRLAPPSENDIALYQRYAFVGSLGVMLEKPVCGTGQDVNPASLKTYTDVVRLSRTGVCSVPYDSFLTYVHTVKEKDRLGC